jgi:alpha-galactosidase
VDQSRESLQTPYRLMAGLLREQSRDIILNLCQYGMGNVWEWGAEIGGHSWRTSGDLGFELSRIFQVALANAEHRQFNGPGSWNDPDYIQIGYIGAARGMGEPQPCPLSPNEQYAFMSLWCLMAAPLFYSGDMERLDAFTLNVLCNPEVIAVNQDPLGKCARTLQLNSEVFLMVKEMVDGSLAVGLFNAGEFEAELSADWDALGIQGPRRVRDLWRHKDRGVFEKRYTVTVPRRAGVLVRLFPLQ